MKKLLIVLGVALLVGCSTDTYEPMGLAEIEGQLEVRNIDIWAYLHESTPVYDFITPEDQTLVFQNEGVSELANVEVGDIVGFPPVDLEAEVLVTGITLEITDKQFDEQTQLLTLKVKEYQDYVTDLVEQTEEELEEYNEATFFNPTEGFEDETEENVDGDLIEDGGVEVEITAEETISTADQDF